MPSAWLRRNVLQPCDGGRLLRAMYLATLVCPISMQLEVRHEFRRSPQWMAKPMSRINYRIYGNFGLPQRGLDFQRQ